MTWAPVAALDNPLDLVALAVLAFLLFGSKLPEVARSLGKSIRELKESVSFDEVSDALSTVNEVRSAVSPTTIARAALPGVAELQDTVGAAKGLVNPFQDAAETTQAVDDVEEASLAPMPEVRPVEWPPVETNPVETPTPPGE